MDLSEQLVLVSSDNCRVVVNRAIATEASYLLRDLVDSRASITEVDGCHAAEEPIEVQLPFISGDILDLVWQHMQYRYHTAVAVDDSNQYRVNVYAVPMKTIPRPMVLPLSDYLDSKDKKFIAEWDALRTVSVVKAATFLRYEELTQLSSAKLASILLDKSVEGIRTLLGVECDFSEEELEALDKESSGR